MSVKFIVKVLMIQFELQLQMTYIFYLDSKK